MKPPLCSDGTDEHVWLGIEESEHTRIDRCAACGQGMVTTTHSGTAVVRYRRGFRPSPTIRPGEKAGAPPAGLARSDVPIPTTAAERRRQMAAMSGGMR